MKDNTMQAKRPNNLPNKTKHYLKLIQRQKVLISMGKEYEIKVVNGNYELISDLFKNKTFKKNDYTIDELRFIKTVRRYIVKNEIYLLPHFQDNQVFAEDVHYVRVARVPKGKTFNNVYEVDIDQAYWETAFQLGIVNEDIYQQGCKGNISKKARLTALGSLAKKVYHYKFKGDQLVNTVVDREELLENLWFTVCKRVSDVMHAVIKKLGRDFIFYWVDGIYFKHTPENVHKVMEEFVKHGYNTKLKKINKIRFHDKGFTVNDYGNIKREFAYPKYSKQGTKINNAENFKIAKVANKIVNENMDMVKEIKKEMDDYDKNSKLTPDNKPKAKKDNTKK